MNVRRLLSKRIADALCAAGAPDSPALVSSASKPEFGDYQANGVMGAAKRLKQDPRTLAQAVLAEAKFDDVVEHAEIAGPGFINLTLSHDFLNRQLEHIEVEQASPAETVVVDYSAPNLAKEMHVGHLRSTIIGDAIAKTLEGLGHRVIRQNHVGDWGTQFGQLVAHLTETGVTTDDLADLEVFYVEASQRFKQDPEFAQRARQIVVALQRGDGAVLDHWRKFIDISLSHCQGIYEKLGVSLRPEHTRGESAYNDDLANVVADLAKAGLLEESDGAPCVFMEEFKAKDGSPLPVIVQKSDGGYLYHTTDLAAIRYRCRTLKADRAIYFVDARQILHFKQLFAVARAAGFAPLQMRLEHEPFGAMLGRDGRPFQTRDGGVVKLAQLLTEARDRASKLVKSKNPGLNDPAEVANIARVVGIGAVKYADLSKNRTSDYVFDWDAMLSFDGNTAPYLQYAYARIQSLFRRGNVDIAALTGELVILEAPERRLAATLLKFQETLEQVAGDAMPHYLCTYLNEVASEFMRFYEHCPVLDADAGVRESRLRLCARTADVLKMGLGFLGIDTVDRM
ncbi:MAG: arginine--tRNA ligase [Gammaproteobacteria bacterium]|nr:arginine--tRNA ligase [Gammaproteobacteria bacterium]